MRVLVTIQSLAFVTTVGMPLHSFWLSLRFAVLLGFLLFPFLNIFGSKSISIYYNLVVPPNTSHRYVSALYDFFIDPSISQGYDLSFTFWCPVKHDAFSDVAQLSSVLSISGISQFMPELPCNVNIGNNFFQLYISVHPRVTWSVACIGYQPPLFSVTTDKTLRLVPFKTAVPEVNFV